jgi:hypothetical protein
MNRVCSIFSQLLQLFSRTEFGLAVGQHKAERHARGFTCWGQFVAMLFCQLGRAHSLREICQGLAASEGKLKHLGVPTAPSRSTLARSRRRKFRFKNKLLSLDATVIDLCASLYDWAKFRRTRGAIKLHLLLDHDGYLPRFAVISDGKVHELKVARKLRWEPGTIVVFDRGYNDYQWFVELTEQGVYWVTRLKDNADYLVVERRPVPAGGKVLADEVICFYSLPGEGREYFFRRVEIFDTEQQRRLVFLSNHLQFGPTTLAAIYKERWQVELFFKALKQLCKIKTFVGTSANAVKTQVWTALIAMLLLRFLQLRAQFGWALSNLLALLRQQLFVHRDLWAWLDDPFQPPPPPPEQQLELALG